MARQTMNVDALREEVNRMIKESVCSREVRQGMASVLEVALHRTGNYNGFAYLTANDVPKKQLPGINTVPGNWMAMDEQVLYDKRFENTDDSRRRYY